MRKYVTVIYLGIVQMFTYRISFVLWRIRNVFNLVFVYFLWTTIFVNRASFLTYTHETIITYVLLVNVLSSLILSTRTTDVANDILSGDVVNYFLKPISFFKFLVSKEIADKLLNFVFSVFEIFVLILIFRPTVFVQTNPADYLFIGASLMIATLISFYSSLTLSLLTFWSHDAWAPRYIYFILVTMLAGTFFPLDVLPKQIYSLLLFTPFPYFIYFPAHLFIRGVSADSLRLFAIGIAWCLILHGLMKYIWSKGIRNYSAYGR